MKRSPGLHAMMFFAPLAAVNVPLAPPAAGPTPDIRAIIPAQPYYVSIGFPARAAAVVLLLLAAWALWYYILRPRLLRPPVRLSPREIAARRLRDLEQQADALEPRVFGAEVCDVLRAYIGAQFGLHPERQTSPEFLTSIATASVFSTEHRSLLAEFLEQCDLLKFARQDATRDAKRRLLTQANDFLQTTSAPDPAAAPAAAVPARS